MEAALQYDPPPKLEGQNFSFFQQPLGRMTNKAVHFVECFQCFFKIFCILLLELEDVKTKTKVITQIYLALWL